MNTNLGKPVDGDNHCHNRPVRLLLAEDDYFSRMLVKTKLESQGLSLDMVSNGQEAVQACSESDYDLVLMDCQMPVLDGYEATRHIRQQENNRRHIPIVALTAYEGAGEAEKCLTAGMDDYLIKPIDFTKLIAVIQKYTHICYTERDLQPVIEKMDFDLVFFESFLSNFKASSTAAMNKIRQAVGDENTTEYRKWLHTFKGQLLIFNAAHAAQTATLMENSDLENDFLLIQRLFHKLEREVMLILKAADGLLTNRQSSVVETEESHD